MTTSKFNEIAKRPARALQAYLVLIGAAANRQTLTYRLLAQKLGFENGQHVLSQTLGHLMYWCQLNSLPSITSLVVQKDDGVPGAGLIAPVDVNAERERVYEYEWYAIVPPTMEELADAYSTGKQQHRVDGGRS